MAAVDGTVVAGADGTAAGTVEFLVARAFPARAFLFAGDNRRFLKHTGETPVPLPHCHLLRHPALTTQQTGISLS